MLSRLSLVAAVACGASAFALSTANQQTSSKPASAPDQKPTLKSLAAMQRFGVLVGDWKGIGMPKRSSRRGAWTVKANWSWQFPKGKPATLVLDSKKGKLVQNLQLSFNEKAQKYSAVLRLADAKQPLTLAAPLGKDAKKVVFDQVASTKSGADNKEPKTEAEPPERYRVTVRILNEKRMLLLVERGSTRLKRVAEIGYTRSGSSIVTRKAGGPECVVTGGAGTIRVTHKGKTYYVCCSGCQQAFADDPEGVLVDYRTRVAAEKAKSAGSGR